MFRLIAKEIYVVNVHVLVDITTFKILYFLNAQIIYDKYNFNVIISYSPIPRVGFINPKFFFTESVSLLKIQIFVLIKN